MYSYYVLQATCSCSDDAQSVLCSMMDEMIDEVIRRDTFENSMIR